jgi:hypothetical protein
LEEKISNTQSLPVRIHIVKVSSPAGSKIVHLDQNSSEQEQCKWIAQLLIKQHLMHEQQGSSDLLGSMASLSELLQLSNTELINIAANAGNSNQIFDEIATLAYQRGLRIEGKYSNASVLVSPSLPPREDIKPAVETKPLTTPRWAKGLGEIIAISICGIMTSIIVAVGDVLVAHLVGIDLFTFSVWLIVPAGALLTGFGAASGYYFGSLYFHRRPNWGLLAQMVITAGATQLLIYYLQYSTLVLDNGTKASASVDFVDYLDYSLTKSHYRLGRGRADTGEVGQFGYWLAGIQFLGFLCGGVAIYFTLLNKPFCNNCRKYYRPLAKRTKYFKNQEELLTYSEALAASSLGSVEFDAIFGGQQVPQSTGKGALSLVSELLSCLTCGQQIVQEDYQVNNGKEWKSYHSNAWLVPSEVDMLSAFGKKTISKPVIDLESAHG